MRYLFLLFISSCLSANPFACELYNQLSKSEGNLFFSPLSLSTALGMAKLGARGKTYEQMELVDATSIDCPLAQLANSLWVQEGFFLLPEFLEQVEAELFPIDFQDHAATFINQWVAAQTEGKITNLVRDDDFSADTRLLLVNAIYMKANWRISFDEENTTQKPFYLENGKEERVPMMHTTGDFLLAQSAKWTAVGLPYSGSDEVAFFVVLPNKGFSLDEMDVSPKMIEKILTRSSSTNLELALPKFTLKHRFSLKKPLISMGMDLPFSRFADFSGITGKDNLYINDVLHEAYLKVDEEGTEAAAATGVVMNIKCAARPLQVSVDRPFLFFIADRTSGTLLFMGRVKNIL